MGFRLGIIFSFLLSIAAAGGSYYLYQSWVEERAVRDSVEAKYDQVKEKMVTVQSEKEQLKSKADAMQEQLEKLETEQSRIDAEKIKLETQLKSHQNMISELQKQVSELAKKAKDAQAACGVTPADLRTDLDLVRAPKPFEPSVSPEVTEETGTSEMVFKPVIAGVTADASISATTPSVSSAVSTEPLVPQVSAPAEGTAVTEVPVATAAVPEVPPGVTEEPVQKILGVPVPTAEGKVLTVNRKFNFVVINQGLQDGLKMGDRLKALKGTQEIATIQVEKLYDKFSAATIVEEDAARQVVEGDDVRRV